MSLAINTVYNRNLVSSGRVRSGWIPTTHTPGPLIFGNWLGPKTPVNDLSPELIARIFTMLLSMWCIEDHPVVRTTLSLVQSKWLTIAKKMPPIFVLERVQPGSIYPMVRKLINVERPFTFVSALRVGDYPAVVEERGAVAVSGDNQERYCRSGIRPYHPSRVYPQDPMSMYAFVADTLVMKASLLKILLIRPCTPPLEKWEMIASCNFPALEVMQIWPSTVGFNGGAVQIPTLKFCAPALHTLALRLCIPGPQNTPLAHLQRLVLHGIEMHDWSSKQFVDFLRAVPNIRSLDFNGNFFFLHNSFDTSKSISFPLLFDITVTWCSSHDSFRRPLNILELLHVPRIQDLVWGVGVAFCHISFIDNPPNRYLADVKVVVCGYSIEKASTTYGKNQKLYTPNWADLPRMPSVHTLVVLEATRSPALRGFLYLFPNILRVFVIRSEPRDDLLYMWMARTELSDEGVLMTRWIPSTLDVAN